ncbi:homeobox-domain-containing protein [Leucogyrophana mollusca]|uniref:Homeobox-domain-containing protein n=1 Tax=Leucogyrophana mollusca TaxID=85980 RepID=A0ACB8BRH7_9AGAM|nr:homeobox-domain-containing protein [Leucogyrophana mollusca]
MAEGNHTIHDLQLDHPSHLDSSAFGLNADHNSESTPSPPSSSAQSPLTPSAPRPSSASAASDTRDGEDILEPSSGPQRSRSTGGGPSKGEREKRKRSRVTPEQLVHLERFFSVDRSPTAARRKEISDLLGMQERQTQIWFQNRRAKAKLQDGKKGRGCSVETPPDTPPELSTGYEAELHSLIHEDEPVTIIPCTDLSVGTWRRIATAVGKHDLVAYLCDAKRCLTWFIHSSGYGFKMEIPFDIIVDTEFTNAAPGSGLASFILSQPPTFYLESFTSPLPGQGTDPIRHWKKCADWTEGQQATKILRHDLIGSAVQLAHVLRHLNTHTSGSDIRLHSPSYNTQPPSAIMEIPQPPMTSLSGPGLSGPGYQYHGEAIELQRPESLSHGRRRSYSGPVVMPDHPPQHDAGHPSLVVDTSGNMSRGPYGPSYSHYPPRSHPMHTSSHSPMFSDYSEAEPQHNMSHTAVDYGPLSFSHDMSSRPYSAGPMPRIYDETGRIMSPYHSDPQGPPSATPFDTPSPPLLTTPFYPQPLLNNSRGAESIDSNGSVISGLPGVTYDSDEDLRRREMH